jgi:hypothetical protein
MQSREVECRLTGEQNRDRVIGVCFLDDMRTLCIAPVVRVSRRKL